MVGHRAPSVGKINLNDLSGSGRLDVLVRGINSALFLSHGIRKDSEITIHLEGNDRPRRIKFDGSLISGLHPDERAIAGQVSKVLQEPLPAIGQWIELHPGLSHSGGDFITTIKEWNKLDITMIKLDSEAPMMSENLPISKSNDFAFFLSDDLSFNDKENSALDEVAVPLSLGDNWIQGHIAIGIVHYQMDIDF